MCIRDRRISIARALLKDAPILILDDSVSAVDTKTEKIILDNLKKSRAGKTTLLIAHRISTVEGLDKIIFQQGAGDGDALLLTARDGDAALAQDSLVAILEVHNVIPDEMCIRDRRYMLEAGRAC